MKSAVIVLMFATALSTPGTATPPSYMISRLGYTDLEHTHAEGWTENFSTFVGTSGIVGTTTRWLGTEYHGETAWFYDFSNYHRIGLVDGEHTSDSGYRFSSVSSPVAGARIAGGSDRYNGSSSFLGQSAWVFSDGVTTKVGLYDAEHTRGDGFILNGAAVAGASHVTGSANRYSGMTGIGNSLWFHDGENTLKIGLDDPMHTRSTDGYRTSGITGISQGGAVFGWSARYLPNGSAGGQSAFAAIGGVTTQIGFTGVDYIRGTDGRAYSEVTQVLASGKALGLSTRYSDPSLVSSNGTGVWISDGTNTMRLGLFDAAHTGADGSQYSSATTSNAAGMVAGQSTQSDPSGRSSWIFDGSSTTRIAFAEPGYETGGKSYSIVHRINAHGAVAGEAHFYQPGYSSPSFATHGWVYGDGMITRVGLVDAEHTRSDGLQYSRPLSLMDDGTAYGESNRLGAAGGGTSVFFYDGTTSTKINPGGAKHTASNGFQSSSHNFTSGNGLVVGTTLQYFGQSSSGGFLGRTLWVHDRTATKELGLTDAMHTGPLGQTDSEFIGQPQAGFIAGTSKRLGAGKWFGTTGVTPWLYDIANDIYHPIVGSVDSSGFAYAWVQWSSGGVAIGTCYHFDESDTMVGARPFYFSIATGFHELGDLVAGGLTNNGWSELGGGEINPLNFILGEGTLLDGNSAAFLMRIPAQENTYANWALDNVEGQGADLDFDGDGIPNGVEYFMGSSPTSFTVNPGIVAGAVTWPRAIDTTISSFRVEVSSDLVSWEDAALNHAANLTIAADQVSLTLPTGQNPFFVRLNVAP